MAQKYKASAKPGLTRFGAAPRRAGICRLRFQTAGLRHSGSRAQRGYPESGSTRLALDSGFALRALRNDGGTQASPSGFCQAPVPVAFATPNPRERSTERRITVSHAALAGVRNPLRASWTSSFEDAAPIGAPPRRFLSPGPCEFDRTRAFALCIPQDFACVRPAASCPKASPRNGGGRRPEASRDVSASHIAGAASAPSTERLMMTPPDKRIGFQIICSETKVEKIPVRLCICG